MQFLIDDLLLIIFENLNYSTLVHLREVNKRFLSLINCRYQSKPFKFSIEPPKGEIYKLFIDCQELRVNINLVYFCDADLTIGDLAPHFDQRLSKVRADDYDIELDNGYLIFLIDCFNCDLNNRFSVSIKNRELAILKLLTYIRELNYYEFYENMNNRSSLEEIKQLFETK